TDRPALHWPGGKTLAVWVNVSLQHFPMNPSAKLKLPGSMTMPYPDLRHFTLRDYGNRVGVWRLMEVFDRFKLPCTVSLSLAVLDMYPDLAERHVSRWLGGKSDFLKA
ncbi:MAG: hypothetical protein RL707_1738, partial [Pseudomonadota bacterium]